MDHGGLARAVSALFARNRDHPADDPDQPESPETEIFSKMHARLWIIPDTRLVASTLLATMVVTGCGENPNNSDGLDEISLRYRSTIRERPVFFGGDETPPETAKELRTLARQATQVSTGPAHLLSAGIHLLRTIVNVCPCLLPRVCVSFCVFVFRTGIRTPEYKGIVTEFVCH